MQISKICTIFGNKWKITTLWIYIYIYLYIYILRMFLLAQKQAGWWTFHINACIICNKHTHTCIHIRPEYIAIHLEIISVWKNVFYCIKAHLLASQSEASHARMLTPTISLLLSLFVVCMYAGTGVLILFTMMNYLLICTQPPTCLTRWMRHLFFRHFKNVFFKTLLIKAWKVNFRGS